MRACSMLRDILIGQITLNKSFHCVLLDGPGIYDLYHIRPLAFALFYSYFLTLFQFEYTLVCLISLFSVYTFFLTHICQ